MPVLKGKPQMKVILTSGARPNFVKLAPLAREFKKYGKLKDFIIVHTGQHYDYMMSRSFFKEFGIPKPDYFLRVGSGTHAEQTARVLVGFEKVCLQEKPDLVVVVGDVNSTLGCALAAKKLNIKIAHVEAGLRSGDMTMPEEVNRILTDAISDYLFVTERSGVRNLLREGRKRSSIFFTGDVMIDTLRFQASRLRGMEKGGPGEAAPKPGSYGVVTLHRPSNVDDPGALRGIIEALVEISLEMPLYFSAHPRTTRNLKTFKLDGLISGSGIRMLPPLSYMKFLSLWKGARAVFTDSGGLQEETTALGVPCFTLRDTTERPVTVEEGTNVIAGCSRRRILKAYRLSKKHKNRPRALPELWDGKAARRIAGVLAKKSQDRRI